MKQKFLIFVSGLFLSLIIGEIGVRLFRKDFFSTSNFILEDLKKELRSKPKIFDAELSWKNPPELRQVKRTLIRTRFSDRKHRLALTTIEDHKRLTPNVWNTRIRENFLILALGDSFTFGGEVSDEETWPTHLQTLLRSRVVNSGVSQYGLDQSYLLLKKLISADRAKPNIVIFSIISENIKRTERKKMRSSVSGQWNEKPYFVVEHNILKLRNVPIPIQDQPPKLDLVRDILGRSYLANDIFHHLAFDFWYGVFWGYDFPNQFKTGEDPAKVSCLILRDLKRLAKQQSFIPVVMVQYYWQDPQSPFFSDAITQEVIKCSRKLGITTLDLEEDLKKLAWEAPEEYNTLYFEGAHMTNRGNLWVAKKLSDFFLRTGIVVN
jgi:hypothetical protein